MMKTERFRLALRELKPSDWERFEQLAAIYLASEFPALRTLATASGDSGRDGTFFAPEGNGIAFQYSVSQDWRQKIRRTVKRLTDKFSGSVRVLVYVSNCRIGADADDLKLELQRDYRIYLDVRDANWFIERVHSNADRQEAAEELARVVVDPFLAGEGIIARKAQALTGLEARTGLLYLTLQWQDTTREKGLTKLSYEALVKAALRGAASANRLTRQEVQDRVSAVLPAHDRTALNQYVSSALARMTKKSVRHWRQQDEFCLAFAEQQRVNDRLAQLELEDGDFERETQAVVGAVADALNINITNKLLQLGVRVRLLLDRFVLNRGEAFASAVISGDFRKLDMQDLKDLVIADVCTSGDAGLGGKITDVLTSTLEEVIWSGSPAVQRYMRRSTDIYTLLAFLRATPDVQQVVEKLFSHGSVWLDTSIVLPAMAEALLDEEQQRFSRLLRIAREAGLDLKITPGVVEEVERHINRAMSCLRAQESWERPHSVLAGDVRCEW